MEDKKAHWETVFTTKTETEVSWYQKVPETSIQFVTDFNLPKTAKIIDIGGGDSYFIDSLLEMGYTNLFLLDISAKAIDRIKNRLGEKSSNVTFIVSDVLDFNLDEKFDFWHDRASFHFLTERNHIDKYAKIISDAIINNGKMVIGTFSENGPLKCSGLEISQYNEQKMNVIFKNDFQLIESKIEDHKTPFGTIQNFIFCSFKRK